MIEGSTGSKEVSACGYGRFASYVVEISLSIDTLEAVLLIVCSDSTLRAMFDGGRKLSIGDTALFQAGNAPPFIGILRRLTQERDATKFSVNWLYRPADVRLAKGVPLEAAPNEIFYSFHKDEISAASLLHPCKVAFLRKGVELPPGISSFVCRRVYDTANKCLWWLTDRDYTDEHQDEVDQLLERTKLEMQAAVQSGGPSPRSLTGPTSSQQLKSSSEAVQNATYSAPNKIKKRERTDQTLEPSKRERSVKTEDGDLSPLKRERSMKPEEIASIIDKDGGLLNLSGVERLVQLMQQDRNDGVRKAADVSSRRTMLAGIVAVTERDDCLNRFVQLAGLPMLDDWLQEAHKGKVGDGGSPKEGDKGVEELLLTLLKALDKLPVDLDALKTCSVGKSVNHLRSHKNLEIQKKARKLVDIWKKRVDAEMKLSGEVKSGSNNGIWSYKQNSPDLLHAHLVKTGVPAEVAVKSSGAFAGSAKPMPNGSCPPEGISKTSPVAAGKVSTLLSSSTPPSVKREEASNSKLPTGTSPLDLPLPIKDEKNIVSLQSQNSGQAWGTGSQAKCLASSSWKEDVKNASMGAAVTSKGIGAGSRHPSLSGKVLVGTSLAGTSKEVIAGKPLVWSRSVVAEKGPPSAPVVTEKGSVEFGRESSNTQHRLIVRIPNPGRSPVRMTIGSFEQAPSVNRGLSPNVVNPERSPSISLDTSDTKSRAQCGNLVATSPEASNEVKSGNGGRLTSLGVEDERCKFTTVQSDTEKREESMRMEVERSFKESHEQNGSTGTVGVGVFVPRNSSTEGALEPGDDKKVDLIAEPVEVATDGLCSEVTAMEVDDLGISLLASVAASEIRRAGVIGTPQERSQLEESGTDEDHCLRVPSGASSLHLEEAPGSPQVGKDGGDCKDKMEVKCEQDAVGNNLSNSREEGDTEQVGELSTGKTCDLESKRKSPQEFIPLSGEGESKDSERKPFTSQEAGRLLEVPSGSGTVKPSLNHKGDDRHMDEGDSELAPTPMGPFTYNKEVKASGTCGSEGSMAAPDGHNIGKLVKKESSDEKKIQGQGKGKISGIELRNGYGNISSELNNMETRSSADSEPKQENVKGGLDPVQAFGGRVMSSEGHKMSDISNCFPEQDVLDVARQAAKEVEQMERYGKSVVSDQEVQDLKSAGFKTSDTRDTSYPDAGWEHRWKSGVSPDKGKDDDTRKRNSVSSEESTHELTGERLDQASSVRSSGPMESEADLARRPGGPGDRKVIVSLPESVEAAPDGVQESQRRAVDVRGLARVPAFHSSQILGLSSLTSTLTAVVSHAVKPSPHSLPGGEPATPEQATETAGPSDGLVGGSDGSERPDFDLNEGFSVEESPRDDSTNSPTATHVSVVATSASAIPVSLLAAPIAIVTATKGGFVLPASPLRTKSELGWKGSAATSAFRPAEPRRTPERQPSTSESLTLEVSSGSVVKKLRPPLDLNIDLNVIDDRTYEEVGITETAAASTLSSQCSVVGMGTQIPLSSTSVCGVSFQADYSGSGLPQRPILDLNMLDESEESGVPLDANSRLTEAMIPSAQSNNDSSLEVTRRVSVLRDFDLNDGPSIEDTVAEDQQVLQPLISRGTGASVMSTGPGLRRDSEVNTTSWYAVNSFQPAIPDVTSTRTDPPYSVASAVAPQSYFSSGAGVVPFNSDLFRASVGISPATPGMTFPPGTQAAYSFTAFSQTPGFPFASAGAFTASNAVPYLDSTGSVSFPIASSGTLTSQLPTRPPYLIGSLPDTAKGGWSARPSLDLNAGPDHLDADGAREDVMDVSPLHEGQPSLEQMRTFRHVAAAGPGGAPPLKRKDPETGWELYRGGFKQAWR